MSITNNVNVEESVHTTQEGAHQVISLETLVTFLSEQRGIESHIQRGVSHNENWVLLISSDYTLGHFDMGVEDQDPQILSTDGTDLDKKDTMFLIIHEKEMFDQDHLYLDGIEGYLIPSREDITQQEYEYLAMQAVTK